MKKYIIISLIALLSFSSCKGFLDQTPILKQSDELSLSTLRNLNLDVYGAYGYLASGQWYGSNFILRTEMAGPNGKRYDDYSTGRYVNEYNDNFTLGNASTLWYTAYSCIYNVNLIMDGLKKFGDTPDTRNLRAECLFLRAISHFDLLRMYARPYSYNNSNGSELGVPIITDVDKSFTKKPKRNTVKECFDQIIKDLSEAETLISDDFTRPDAKDPYAVVSKQAIQALLARAYQYSEQWAKAAEYATKVINSGKYHLWTQEELKNGACYRLNVPDPKSTEVIFEVYSNTDNTTNPYRESLSFMTQPQPNGYGDAGTDPSLISLYGSNDVRSTLFDKRSNGNWTLKYKGKGLGSPDFNNTIILRLSEMYLIRAEAGLHVNTGSSTAADLKAIANARGAKPQSPTLDGVLTECRKEFAWEGHLWFDLQRNGKDLVHNAETYTGPKSSLVIKANDFRWLSAIPKDEVNVNTNLVQNPGYSK